MRSATFACSQRAAKCVAALFTFCLAHRRSTSMNCSTLSSITFRPEHPIDNLFTTPKLPQPVSAIRVLQHSAIELQIYLNCNCFHSREISAVPLWHRRTEYESLWKTRPATIQSSKCANKRSSHARNKWLVDTIPECSTVGKCIGPLSNHYIEISWLQSHRFCVWLKFGYGSS